MIESLAVYRNSPDELGEYEENIRRRRKNTHGSLKKKKKHPKIKAIMAILGDRRIDDGDLTIEDLQTILELLQDNSEGIKKE